MFKLGRDYSLDELKDYIQSLRKQEEKSSKAWIWIALLAVVALIGGAIFVWYKFFKEDDFYDDYDDLDDFDYEEYDSYEEDEEEDLEGTRDYGIVYEEQVVVDEEPVEEEVTEEAEEETTTEEETEKND